MDSQVGGALQRIDLGPLMRKIKQIQVEKVFTLEKDSKK